jgi:thiamine pyrophosphokinase
MNALIIANGELPPPAVVRSLARHADQIVCADGGANHARRLRIRPDIILGDLDSVTGATLRSFRTTALAYVDDQNSTDLEKALWYSVHHGCSTVHVVGGLGSRIDHTAGSLGCVRRFLPFCRVILHDTGGYLQPVGKEIRFAARAGETISLIPLTRCGGVTTVNLRYPLQNEILELGVREGISNVAMKRMVTIGVRRGILLLYRVRQA